MPPNAGQSAWWLHQSQSRLGLGPEVLRVAVARSIACHSATRVRSNRSSSSASGA